MSSSASILPAVDYFNDMAKLGLGVRLKEGRWRTSCQPIRSFRSEITSTLSTILRAVVTVEVAVAGCEGIDQDNARPAESQKP
jgi:hypothetical protein